MKSGHPDDADELVGAPAAAEAVADVQGTEEPAAEARPAQASAEVGSGEAQAADPQAAPAGDPSSADAAAAPGATTDAPPDEPSTAKDEPSV